MLVLSGHKRTCPRGHRDESRLFRECEYVCATAAEHDSRQERGGETKYLLRRIYHGTQQVLPVPSYTRQTSHSTKFQFESHVFGSFRNKRVVQPGSAHKLSKRHPRSARMFDLLGRIYGCAFFFGDRPRHACNTSSTQQGRKSVHFA